MGQLSNMLCNTHTTYYSENEKTTKKNKLRYEGNIKMEIKCDYMDWTHLALFKGQCLTFLNSVFL